MPISRMAADWVGKPSSCSTWTACSRSLQASLDTALQIHPQLARYVVCFPFDPTGPTARKGRNEVEKFNAWRAKSEAAASKKGRQLVIEDWPASRLLSELLKNDASGGLRSYFFDATVFSESWFKQHLETAVLAAGPRYTPKLTVETELWKWFSALGYTTQWSQAFHSLLKPVSAALKDLRSAVERGRRSPMDPEWPEDLRAKATSCISSMETLRSTLSGLAHEPSRKTATECVSRISQCLGELRELNLAFNTTLKPIMAGVAQTPRAFVSSWRNMKFPFPLQIWMTCARL